MKKKSDFIVELLSTKTLPIKYREEILKLSLRDIEGNRQKMDDIIQIIEDLNRKQEAKLDKLEQKIKGIEITELKTILNKDSNVGSKEEFLKHKPKEVTKFLKNFEENTALKFSTHIWDKTDFLITYDSFIEKLNDELKEFKLKDIFNYNRHLYNQLVYFLSIPKIDLVNGIPAYGWNMQELKEIRIGWQFPPNLLREWSIENYENDIILGKKYPMEMEVPKALIPEARIRNKNLKLFEDVANIFKTEIQFRSEEENLFKSVEFLIKKYKLTNNDSSINKLKRAHFFTYTRGINSALDSIFHSFVTKNENYKDVTFDVISKNDTLEVTITHVGSFPYKELNLANPNHFFSGDSNTIVNHFFSLCDYSILSKFNQNKFYEVEILCENSHGIPDKNNLKSLTSSMNVIEADEKIINGFSHKMKFYV